MAVIEEKYWNGEPLKAVIHFDIGLEYTVYSDNVVDGTGNYIQNIAFSLTEGNCNVNPLGISISNSISMSIYDTEDRLSTTNKSSIYYGKIVNGVRIELFISYDKVNWEPYGEWYTTSWSGEFSDGSHGLISLTAEDKLNTIGAMEMPKVKAYNNEHAANMIADVFRRSSLESWPT